MIIVRRGRPIDRASRGAELEDLYRSLMSPRGSVTTRSSGTWRPPIDVYEEAGLVTIVAELAGMASDEIEIILEGENVSLRGTRLDRHAGHERSFHEAHIPYGQFAADIYIPFAIDTDAVEATYENGFLRISIPRIHGRRVVPITPSSDDHDRSHA